MMLVAREARKAGALDSPAEMSSISGMAARTGHARPCGSAQRFRDVQKLGRKVADLEAEAAARA